MRPVGEGQAPSSGDGHPRPHRRRRTASAWRRRRPSSRQQRIPWRLDDRSGGPERPVEGVLSLPARENAPGVLVSSKANYLPSPKDPLVPRELINREGLESGALISGFAADGNRPVVKRIEMVEGLEPAAFRQRPTFNDLISIDPHHLQLETESDEMCGLVDLSLPSAAPALFDRGAPRRSATRAKRMAHAVSVNDPTLRHRSLIDERPEEITDFRAAFG
jgi:transcription termination factor Rho